MGKAKVAIVVFLVVVLFASSLGSVAIYYVTVVSDKDSKISTLKSQISALQSQTSTLESQIAMLQSQIAEATETATIKTALGVVDIPSDKTFQMYTADNKSHVYVTGSIFNAGGTTAINLKLQVLAFDWNGNTLMNTTTSVQSGVWDVERNSKGVYGNGFEFGNISPNGNVTVSLSIYHKGFFPASTTTYEIIPVWTN
jgi:hypothetical protein